MHQYQATISKSVSVSGRGLQTGEKVELICIPAPRGEGIKLFRTDIPGNPGVKLGEKNSIESKKRRSAVAFSGVSIQTLEHFMSALWAMAIDNVRVEIKGPELPVLDGSALGFMNFLEGGGREEQDVPREYLKVDRTVSVEKGDAGITAEPFDGFAVEYEIDYPIGCIRKSVFEIDLNERSFREEIAPARTFCLKKEAVFLFLSGMGRGSTFENTLILGNKGPVRTKFRFPDEPVRHKVLDLVGDMYMMGRPVLGKFVCKKSGHALNAEILRKISELEKAQKDETIPCGENNS